MTHEDLLWNNEFETDTMDEYTQDSRDYYEEEREMEKYQKRKYGH